MIIQQIGEVLVHFVRKRPAELGKDKFLFSALTLDKLFKIIFFLDDESNQGFS
jgi:hypothetical protein